jgi:hypothetical protein
MVTISAHVPAAVNLTNKAALSRLNGQMIGRLVTHHRVSRPHAEQMIGFLWDRWINRIVEDLEFQQRYGDQDEPTQRQWAERIMDGALGYWRACAMRPGAGLGPSPLIDIGVHTGHLYTMEFEALSFVLAGRFLHHCPTDIPGVDYGQTGGTDTVAVQRELGLSVDESLWTGMAGCGARECTGGDCTEGGPAYAGSTLSTDDWAVFNTATRRGEPIRTYVPRHTGFSSFDRIPSQD